MFNDVGLKLDLVILPFSTVLTALKNMSVNSFCLFRVSFKLLNRHVNFADWLIKRFPKFKRQPVRHLISSFPHHLCNSAQHTRAFPRVNLSPFISSWNGWFNGLPGICFTCRGRFAKHFFCNRTDHRDALSGSSLPFAVPVKPEWWKHNKLLKIYFRKSLQCWLCDFAVRLAKPHPESFEFHPHPQK